MLVGWLVGTAQGERGLSGEGSFGFVHTGHTTRSSWRVLIDEASPCDTVGRCDLCNIVDYIALCVFRSYRRYRLYR